MSGCDIEYPRDQMVSDIEELYGMGAYSVLPCGSRFTCDPPVLNTDVDYALRVKDLQDAKLKAHELGYVICPVEKTNMDYSTVTYEDHEFFTARRGPVNIIVMTEARFLAFKTASYICGKLNLKDRSARVVVFDTIREKLLGRLKFGNLFDS